VLELILRHAGPLQPNKGSVAHLRATSRAGTRRGPDSTAVLTNSNAKSRSAHRRNGNSTRRGHNMETRRLLRQLLTGSLTACRYLTPSTPAGPNCCCSKGPAPYWSNPLFLVFDIRALCRSVLTARPPKCQKLKMVG